MHENRRREKWFRLQSGKNSKCFRQTRVGRVSCIMAIVVVIMGCYSSAVKVDGKPHISIASQGNIKLHKLKKLWVKGDFDGDHKQDTLFQHLYSKRTRKEIEYAADPFQNEWDQVEKWFYDQEADVYLTLNQEVSDTLHFGTAQGLYCLINLGDNNADGKDEIALVVDYLDYSRVNSCKIYALCKGKWTLLQQFGVHEDAFNFSTEREPLFENIKEFLEFQEGRWVYRDYSQIAYDRPEDVGKMMPLHPEKCH